MLGEGRIGSLSLSWDIHRQPLDISAPGAWAFRLRLSLIASIPFSGSPARGGHLVGLLGLQNLMSQPCSRSPLYSILCRGNPDCTHSRPVTELRFQPKSMRSHSPRHPSPQGR